PWRSGAVDDVPVAYQDVELAILRAALCKRGPRLMRRESECQRAHHEHRCHHRDPSAHSFPPNRDVHRHQINAPEYTPTSAFGRRLAARCLTIASNAGRRLRLAALFSTV